MDDIFDIPIQAGSLKMILLQTFINKKDFELINKYNSEYTILCNKYNWNSSCNWEHEPLEMRQYKEEHNKQLNEWSFVKGYFVLHNNHSLKSSLINFVEQLTKPNQTHIQQVHYEGFRKYGDQWIQDLKNEYLRIHRFLNFDPLDVYKKNQELIIKNEKLEKQMSEIETMVLYLSKELENLKKPNTEIPNLIDF